jgi:integrase
LASFINDKGRLILQFRFGRRLCREYLGVLDTRDNRRRFDALRRTIQAELGRREFDYLKHFPESRAIKRFGLAPKAEPVTLGSYYRRWLETLEVSKSTHYDYESIGRVYLDRTPLGEKLIGDVTPTDIREVVRAATAEDTRVRRVTMFLQRLRSMFNAAIEDELLERNPALRVKNPRWRTRREPIESFTPAEQVALINAATGQDRNLIVVLMGTGARPGEILALRRKDVDLQGRKLSIAGSRGRFGEGPTKTALSTRTIDLVDTVAPVITALHDQLAAPRLGPLFANRAGKFLNFPNWRERVWPRLLKSAGVPYRTPYAMRHTYAVRMLEAGHVPVYVAGQMGHTSPEMIYRHYARWTTAPAESGSAKGKF